MCQKRKKCENYYKECETHDTNTIQCLKLSDSDYCKIITIDDNCSVNSDKKCANKKIINNIKICSLDEKTNLTSCKIRDKLYNEINGIGSSASPIWDSIANYKYFYDEYQCYITMTDNFLPNLFNKLY